MLKEIEYMALVVKPIEVETHIWSRLWPEPKPKVKTYGFGYAWIEAKSQAYFRINCL